MSMAGFCSAMARRRWTMNIRRWSSSPGYPPLECGGLPPLLAYERRRQAAALRRLNLLLSGRRAKMPATTHPFAELLPFFGSHLLPALHHPTPPVHVRSRPAAEASEEDLAQDQQSQRLPERNGMPAEDWRDEPVPQTHDHK